MKKIIVPTVLCATVLLFAGCAKRGPMESAGHKVDEAAHTIQNGGEKTTGDKISDAADDAKNGAEKAADDLKKQ
jgi:predicted small lipoprotein YifL